MPPSGPRSVNVVTFALLLAALGGGYWVWKYFPHYFTAWKVDTILHDGAMRTYKVQRLDEPYRSQERQKLVESMREKIVALGIDDPEMSVDLEIEGEEVTVTSDYVVEVHHPVGNKVSQVTMHRKSTGDIKRVNWDDQ